MTGDSAPGESGHDDATDLGWLADRFLLGDLSAAEEEDFVARLDGDDERAAAVARSSRVLAVLRAGGRVPPRVSPPGRRRGIVTAVAVAAAVAAVACWRAVGPPADPVVAAGPRDVVRLWRQADEAEWSDQDPGTEDEVVEGDAVPDWMLAAVGLDAPTVLDGTDIQEN